MKRKTINLPDLVDQTMVAHEIWKMLGNTILADDYKLLYLALRDELKKEIGV